MFGREDTTYQDLRDRSYFQWLDDMEKYDDIAVRCGVKLAREYVEYLKEKNRKLEEECQLKNKYLKKMAENKRSVVN